MKEININIEGYNVNGICVGCLNYNRKMFYCNEIKECFKLIGNIDVPDGLSIQVCWECLADVRSVLRFQARILRSFEFLINYSHENTFLNCPEDFTEYSSTRLTTSPMEVHSMLKDEEELIEVKVEDDLKYEPFESSSLKEEKDYTQDDFSEDLPSQEVDASSEDDIQLSKLKKKKEKREKKSKKDRKKKEKHKPEELQLKASRKLKNLPEDLVELYSMSEEEMWAVRASDVASADFTNLRYKCTDCILGFNTEKLMADHFNGKHRVKGDVCHQCNICKAYFLTKDNLSVHRSLHLTAYRCKQCGAKTSLKRLMLKHVSSHRRDADEYKCSTCGGEFSTKSKLTYHKGVCHQEKPQCDCCGKVFANKMTLKYHLKILPQNKDDKPKEKLHIPCKGCNKVFHSKKSYRAHVVIHDGLTYPCPTCGKLFQWKRNLARHARNHREREAGALHECKDCGKTFASRDCYANHLRLSKRHAAEDSYAHECNYCGKKFPTKWCMVDHIDWDHLKRIKYQCSVCFKPFKTAKIMVAHVNNIHEGKKREQEGEHLCEICGKSYKTVKRLKGHVWAMHTKRSTTKSFKCKLCPATFTWQTSIYKHVKIMHDSGKRKQQARPPPVKKEEYPVRLELANVQYFQQNIANNLMQNIVQSVHVQHAGVMQNLV
ncbi:zinc finger protein 665 isoform X1 [Manduca sexta]|uniref:zinc finger protein 665 isoform X1 n=1 Tax=Manduca sexta TaxID=7130 RepID=UPI00188F70E9|nr:zinc finger protein 665 isoform X1 [Manduca sexta]